MPHLHGGPGETRKVVKLIQPRFGTNSKSGELFFFTYDHQHPGLHSNRFHNPTSGIVEPPQKQILHTVVAVVDQTESDVRYLIKTTSELEARAASPQGPRALREPDLPDLIRTRGGSEAFVLNLCEDTSGL